MMPADGCVVTMIMMMMSESSASRSPYRTQAVRVPPLARGTCSFWHVFLLARVGIVTWSVWSRDSMCRLNRFVTWFVSSRDPFFSSRDTYRHVIRIFTSSVTSRDTNRQLARIVTWPVSSLTRGNSYEGIFAELSNFKKMVILFVVIKMKNSVGGHENVQFSHFKCW